MTVDEEVAIALHESAHAVSIVSRGGRFLRMEYTDPPVEEGVMALTMTSARKRIDSKFSSFAGPWADGAFGGGSLTAALEAQVPDAETVKGYEPFYADWSKELSGLTTPITHVANIVLDYGPSAITQEVIIAALLGNPELAAYEARKVKVAKLRDARQKRFDWQLACVRSREYERRR